LFTVSQRGQIVYILVLLTYMLVKFGWFGGLFVYAIVVAAMVNTLS